MISSSQQSPMICPNGRGPLVLYPRFSMNIFPCAKEARELPAWITSGPRYDVAQVLFSYLFTPAMIAVAHGWRMVSIFICLLSGNADLSSSEIPSPTSLIAKKIPDHG